MTYLIVPERSHDGSWWAPAPDLPGLPMYGNAREELASAPDAILDYLDAIRDYGHPVPVPETHCPETSASQERPVPVTVSAT
ncbi:MAG: type II toxin-antitoxin system HicB family antitoxin [Candidatus Eremiobacteraeota bacterium]|nr:type II toxin-antitoxin system HicB family antitoxin [Candidatus Eremiobacteraeota bacterium]